MLTKERIFDWVWTFLLVGGVYIFWAVQPLPVDDWVQLSRPSLFPLPSVGQEVRPFVGRLVFTTSVFSLFKPASLFTAIFLFFVFSKALKFETNTVRRTFVLLLLLGFPYLSNVAPWNLAAADYVVAVFWVFVWVHALDAVRERERAKPFRFLWLFAASFCVSLWHEAWVLVFGLATVFLIGEAAFKRSDGPVKVRARRVSAIVVLLGYALAAFYFTYVGAEGFIDRRLVRPGHFASLFTGEHIAHSVIWGSKEVAVLLKDALPVVFLIVFLRLNAQAPARLTRLFPLLLVLAIGAIGFIYAGYFVAGAIHWRARWLCMALVVAAFFATPRPLLDYILSKFKWSNDPGAMRALCALAAAGWLFFNVFFAYIYTNIDVPGWLTYRERVIDRDPSVLTELCCTTIPEGRPRGVADWEHPWGAQDDRYRYFYGPSLEQAQLAVAEYWQTP